MQEQKEIQDLNNLSKEELIFHAALLKLNRVLVKSAEFEFIFII